MKKSFEDISVLVRYITGNSPRDVSEACLFLCIWAESAHEDLYPYIIDEGDLALILEVVSSQFDSKASLYYDECFDYISKLGTDEDRVGEQLNPLDNESDREILRQFFVIPVRKSLVKAFNEHLKKKVKISEFWKNDGVVIYADDDVMLATIRNIKKVSGDKNKDQSMNYSAEMEIPFVSEIVQMQALLTKKMIQEYSPTIESTLSRKGILKFLTLKEAKAVISAKKYVQSASFKGLNLTTDGKII